MISSASQLKSPKMDASLADSLGIPVNESLKTKIPLRQIVQFAERLQAQNLEGKAELQKFKQENIILKNQCKDYDAMKAEIDQLHEKLRGFEDLKAAIQILKSEKISLQETVDVMSIQLNYMPILQHELKCEGEENQMLGSKIDDMKMVNQKLQDRVKEMEDSATAFDVRLDSQLRTVNRLNKENAELKKINQELGQKLELFLNDQLIKDLGHEDIVKLLKKAALLKDVDQEHIMFEKKLLQQLDKLKKENRNLLTEKIKLESDFWGKDYEASSNFKLLESDLLKTKKSLTGLQSDLDIKSETIENLQIERNELRQIKESLNNQVFSKSYTIEKMRESLLRLKEKVEGNVVELSSIPRNISIPDTPVYIFKNSTAVQTLFEEPETHDISKYQEKIMELETEVTALSLYITKMVSRVAGNQNLQSALFFDKQIQDLSPPSPAETADTPEESNSPKSFSIIPSSKELSMTDSKRQQILKGTTEWIRGLTLFNASQINPS